MDSTQLSVSRNSAQILVENIGHSSGEIANSNLDQVANKVPLPKAETEGVNTHLNQERVTEPSFSLLSQMKKWVPKAAALIGLVAISLSPIALFIFPPAAPALFLGGALLLMAGGHFDDKFNDIEKMNEFVDNPNKFQPTAAGQFCVHPLIGSSGKKDEYNLLFYDGHKSDSFSLKKEQNGILHSMNRSEVERFVKNLQEEMQNNKIEENSKDQASIGAVLNEDLNILEHELQHLGQEMESEKLILSDSKIPVDRVDKKNNSNVEYVPITDEIFEKDKQQRNIEMETIEQGEGVVLDQGLAEAEEDPLEQTVLDTVKLEMPNPVDSSFIKSRDGLN